MNRTFIDLGTERQEEYNQLEAAGEKYVIFTNREVVLRMKMVKGIRDLFQIQGEDCKKLHQKWTLNTAILPCF